MHILPNINPKFEIIQLSTPMDLVGSCMILTIFYNFKTSTELNQFLYNKYYIERFRTMFLYKQTDISIDCSFTYYNYTKGFELDW